MPLRNTAYPFRLGGRARKSLRSVGDTCSLPFPGDQRQCCDCLLIVSPSVGRNHRDPGLILTKLFVNHTPFRRRSGRGWSTVQDSCDRCEPTCFGLASSREEQMSDNPRSAASFPPHWNARRNQTCSIVPVHGIRALFPNGWAKRFATFILWRALGKHCQPAA